MSERANDANVDALIARLRKHGSRLTTLGRVQFIDASIALTNEAADALTALQADAERYRWLRQMDRADAWSSLLAPEIITGALDVDAAIDRAREESNG